MPASATLANPRRREPSPQHPHPPGILGRSSGRRRAGALGCPSSEHDCGRVARVAAWRPSGRRRGTRQLLRLAAEDRKRQWENPRFPRRGTFANPGAGPTAFAPAVRALPETEQTQKRSKTPLATGCRGRCERSRRRERRQGRSRTRVCWGKILSLCQPLTGLGVTSQNRFPNTVIALSSSRHHGFRRLLPGT